MCIKPGAVQCIKPGVIHGADTRVVGYNGQPVSMPEVSDLQRNQTLLLSYLKSIRVDPEDGDKLSRSEIGRKGADARWNK